MRAVDAHGNETSESGDKTTLYGVRTQPIHDIGELWIPCYTVTMMSIDELKRPYLRLEFSKHRLSRQDITAVQERVRLYLGVES